MVCKGLRSVTERPAQTETASASDRHRASPSQERVPAEAAAGPDSIGAAGSSLLAAAAAAGGRGAAEPGSPASTSGSATTCSSVPASAPSSLLSGAGEQRSHAGQHLQLRPAQAVHRRSEPRRLGLRHPVVRLLGVQPVLPSVPPHHPQALRQGQHARVPQGRERGVPRLSVLPASASSFPH